MRACKGTLGNAVIAAGAEGRQKIAEKLEAKCKPSISRRFAMN
jgi:hypothetical protein